MKRTNRWAHTCNQQRSLPEATRPRTRLEYETEIARLKEDNQDLRNGIELLITLCESIAHVALQALNGGLRLQWDLAERSRLSAMLRYYSGQCLQSARALYLGKGNGS